MKSYLSPKTKKTKDGAIHGIGLFATDTIKKGEIVAVKSGNILTKEQLMDLDIDLHAELQVADNLFITPTNAEEYDKNMVCINHSCNPNVGMQGNIIFVALSDILPGQELTMDYVLIDNDPSKAFACGCSAANCRKTVSGIDWQKSELQEKFKGYFSGYIQSLITKHSCAA